VREFSDEALPPQTLSDLLWAACGINRRNGPFGVAGRTVASASNAQEVDVFVALVGEAARRGEQIDISRDEVIHKRVRRWSELQAETKRLLDQRQVPEPYEDISPSIALPLIEAALDEDRDGLKELWARLLAAAMDPARKNRVRLYFTTTVKQMDPLDARILEALYTSYEGGFPQNEIGRDILAKQLGVSPVEVLVSFRNLERLECIDFVSPPKVSPLISASGQLLIAALRE
jgi:hypothetical protein